jgi:hypothetical protein
VLKLLRVHLDEKGVQYLWVENVWAAGVVAQRAKASRYGQQEHLSLISLLQNVNCMV